MIDVSLVIPLLNEAESLPELCSWIVRVCEQEKLSYEVLLLDDGSTDNSWDVIEELAKANKKVKFVPLFHYELTIISPPNLPPSGPKSIT